jgi:hypothetical protein
MRFLSVVAEPAVIERVLRHPGPATRAYPMSAPGRTRASARAAPMSAVEW